MPCTPDTTSHPCFTEKAAQSCGRVHLPVAPKCNVLCGYCNRKYDCVNESRPGVTSGVLTPAQAADYLDRVLERHAAGRVEVCHGRPQVAAEDRSLRDHRRRLGQPERFRSV